MEMKLSFWQEVFAPQADVKRLHLLNQIEHRQGTLARAQHRRLARMHLHQAIKACDEQGKVAVIVTSRDCDMCEGTSRSLIAANVHAYDKFVNRQLDTAEGPMHFHLQAPSDSFEYRFRDLAAEAFEDGHPHVVYA